MGQLLNYLEDKDMLINDDWFYHATSFSIEKYKNVLNNGILSPYLLQQNSSSYKYVFVSRKDKNTKNSAFDNYSIYPSFVIDGSINAIKADDCLVKKLIYGGNHGLSFTSLFDDEYQVYKKINPDKIVAILFNLEKLISDNKNNEYLYILRDLVILLNELNISYPIFDYYTKKEINKQRVLSLIKY